MKFYNVHRIYSLKENIKLLSVKKLETMHKDELWQFILLTFSDEIVRLDDNPYWYNSELKQDSIMNELLQNKKEEIQNRFSEKGFERYYEKEKYKKLIALPSLNETNIQKLSKVFKQKRFSENELNEGYYQSFVYVGSNPRNKSDIKRRLDLEDLIIENGFQPFSSIAVYLESELDEKSNSAPTDYGGTIIFGLFIIFASLLTNPAALVILILLVLAVVYLLKYLKDKRMEKVQLEVIKPFTANKSKPEVTPQNSEQNTQEQDKFSEKITEKKEYKKIHQVSNYSSKSNNVLRYIVAIIIGCYLGVKGGWELGIALGYTGGNSIGKIMFAMIGLPIGASIGLAIAIYLAKKDN